MSFMSVERIIDGPWDVFEKTVLRLLIHSGWKQIIHTGRTGDMGADIIGIDTSGKKVILFVNRPLKNFLAKFTFNDF